MVDGPHYSDIHKLVNIYIHNHRQFDLNCAVVIGIRVKPLVHVPNIKHDNSSINRRTYHLDLPGPPDLKGPFSFHKLTKKNIQMTTLYINLNTMQ